MPNAYGTFSGRPNHRLNLYIYVAEQDAANNRSKIAWGLYAERTGGAVSFYNDPIGFSVNVGGNITNGSHGLPFSSGTWQIQLATGEHWFGHDGNGYLGAVYSSANMLNAGQFGSAQTPAEPVYANRIPKAPQAPNQGNLSDLSPTSARVNGTTPDDMGSGINLYQFQAATDAGFNNGLITRDHGGPVLDIGGLAPGNTYHFRLRARNGVGWSGWSNTRSAYIGLPAPTLNSWAQNSTGGLVATWSPPSTTTGLIGYRVQVATNAAFTANVVTSDVGVVTTATLDGLAGGRRYWARVAARTAGGVNAYSGARDTMLVLASGDLDGWTRTTTRPAALAYFTDTGIRRGIVNGAQGLYLESISTGTAQTIPANMFGIQRVLTGLTPGASYRFQASMTGSYTGALSNAQARAFRLGVNGTLGDPLTLLVGTATVVLPFIEFIAATDTVTLRILGADPLVLGAADVEAERIAFHGITVAQLDTDYPQRLRNTVYESNLANHFDLACNSVGATWYVAKDGVTRFNPPGAALPISAVFSDARAEGVLEYVDIAAGYDTLGTVNRISATNYGIGDDDLEENDDLVVDNAASQALYGILSSRLDVNLWDEAPYDTAFADRLQHLLDTHDAPELFVSEIRWNAQQNLAALAELEVGQRVLVRYRGTVQDSQIVSLAHDVQPTRWITTIALQKL